MPNTNNSYSIVTDNMKVDDVVAQLRAIKEFPATIKIYDRVLLMVNFNENWAFTNGLETGWYLSEEKSEQASK